MENVESTKIFERCSEGYAHKRPAEEKVQYRTLQHLIDQGAVEKVRYGYYQWIDPKISVRSLR